MTKRPLFALSLLLAATLSLTGEIFYPWKDTFIGALDAAGWPGLVIAPTADAAFAFVLRVEREGGRRGRRFLLPRLPGRRPFPGRALCPDALRPGSAVQTRPRDTHPDEALAAASGPHDRMVAPGREDGHRPDRLPRRRPDHPPALFSLGSQGRVRAPR
ncbi:MAG: hypothetical protein MZV70_66890 [Desulfobacterales bacterium]|nr:hypothetical protein [Desulfobacterales bacterium]